MKKGAIFFALLAMVLLSCENKNDNETKSAKNEYEINNNLPPSGETMSKTDRARVDELIVESKKTLDSIDVAYSFVRKESRLQNLSLDEREQVNEALIELNDAKDLIVLEMEQTIINDLKAKTETLQIVMQDMNAKSEKLMHIAHTLSRISGVISKTTNLLAGALAVGLIRPRIAPTPSS